MSNVLNWIKSNVVIVACLVVMVIAMVSLLWPTGAANAAFQEKLNARPQQLSKINEAINRRVTIPSQDPNSPPVSKTFTVNPAAVEQLHRIFQRMNNSYDQLYKDALAFNQAGPGGNNPHTPMIQGLFGVLNPSAVTRIQAVGAYGRALGALYTQPALRAGTPPTAEDISRRLAEVERIFVATYLGAAANTALTDPELVRQKAEEKRNLLVNRANSIGVYMDPPSAAVGAGNNTLSSFQVTALANMDKPPEMSLLWESQMQLWIQQDLLYAVALANRQAGVNASVLKAPVKRVVAMTIKPGYVGVSAATASPTGVPAPAVPEDINNRMPDNFTVNPTGRRSNALYDVRTATLSVLIDARHIPTLLNAICQTNFMTPIIDKISTVDQLELVAKDGYVFGDNVDVVQLDLTIETLWLRRWTAGQTDDGAIEAYKHDQPNAPNFSTMAHDEQVKYLKQNNQYDLGLMPDVIRVELGLPPRDPNYKPAGALTPGGPAAPGGMFPGRPGGDFPGGFDDGMMPR